jgi:hypothetical protein
VVALTGRAQSQAIHPVLASRRGCRRPGDRHGDGPDDEKPDDEQDDLV